MSKVKNYPLPGAARVKTGKEFAEIRRRGRLFRTPHFLVYVHKNGTSQSRLGLTVSRKVGNAVKRNRVKRLLRECYRIHLQKQMVGYDLSIIARSGAHLLSFAQVVPELQERLGGKKV